MSSAKKQKTGTWSVDSSVKSQNTSNPIRAVVDGLDMSKVNKDKTMIPFSLGDPTAFGNLRAPKVLEDALIHAVT